MSQFTLLTLSHRYNAPLSLFLYLLFAPVSDEILFALSKLFSGFIRF